MIRQNRAVPILMVLTLAWVLYLAGCFGSEEPTTSVEEVPTAVIATPTPAPVVTGSGPAALAAEEPFVHTIEEGDLLSSIATKYNVTADVILRANPDLNPNVLIVGDTLRIPGASTENTVDEDRAAARQEGEPIDYVVESGDNLGAIARTWVVSLDALIEANPGIDPNSLQVGQLIVVPPYGTGLSPQELAAFSTPVPGRPSPGPGAVPHRRTWGSAVRAGRDLLGDGRGDHGCQRHRRREPAGRRTGARHPTPVPGRRLARVPCRCGSAARQPACAWEPIRLRRSAMQCSPAGSGERRKAEPSEAGNTVLGANARASRRRAREPSSR